MSNSHSARSAMSGRLFLYPMGGWDEGVLLTNLTAEQTRHRISTIKFLFPEKYHFPEILRI